jgi:Acyl-CoA dehydrogenase, N-terminal domain
MYEDYFTEEHNIFRAAVRKFVEKEIKPHIDIGTRKASFPSSSIRSSRTRG